MTHKVALISISLALSQTSVYTARPQMEASASCGVTAFAGTHCIYQWRDGQAECAWNIK